MPELIYYMNVLLLDNIDVVGDKVPSSEYKVEEDPKLYQSAKTGRGPLSEDWLQSYNPQYTGKPCSSSVMCAYKLCRVEFRYWGMQTKIEWFIHNVAIRKTLVRAHRQAWCWQDEWFGLTMEDIRTLEEETKILLSKKLIGQSLNTIEQSLQDINDRSQHLSVSIKEKIDLNQKRCATTSVVTDKTDDFLQDHPSLNNRSTKKQDISRQYSPMLEINEDVKGKNTLNITNEEKIFGTISAASSTGALAAASGEPNMFLL